MKLCQRSKEEGKAEVLNDNVLSSMGINQRISTILYVLWLVVEGGFVGINRSFPSIADSPSGLETVLMYLVGSSFALLVLHSYVGGKWAKSGLRGTVIGHQLVMLSLSLYGWTVLKDSNVRSWHGFRIGVMGYCVVSEMLAQLVDLRNQID